MLFNIEADTGDTLVGYLVPDSYTETPRLCLIGGGRLLWSGEANETRAALVAAGRHRTGRCGFRIGPAEVPLLQRLPEVEVRDLASGITIYRRTRDRPVLARRVFRVETRLIGLHRFDHGMEPHFQGWFPGIDRHGAETIDQTLHMNAVGSVYASGRVQVAAHPALTAGDTALLALLRDPFAELAERIAVLGGARGPLARVLPGRERMTYRGAIEALDGIDPGQPRALRRFFRRIDPAVAAELSNPLVRQLTAPAPAELPGPGAVAAALRTLAGFDVVAPAEVPGLFEAAVAAFLGLPAVPAVADPFAAAVADSAAELARIGMAEAMLEADLEVYASLSAVVERIAPGIAPGIATGIATGISQGAAGPDSPPVPASASSRA